MFCRTTCEELLDPACQLRSAAIFGCSFDLALGSATPLVVSALSLECLSR